MAIVGYKARPRMRSWTMPEPPPPRKSRFLWLSLLAWIAAIAIAFRWVWPEGSSLFRSEERETSVTDSTIDELATSRRASLAVDPESKIPSTSSSTPASGETSRDPNTATPPGDETPNSTPRARATAPRSPAELPECEVFLGEAKAAGYGRLPTHIGLSPLDTFVGSTQWTKPCQGRKRRTVELCAAIRDGSLVGLTLHAKPVDLTLEECLREAALKLTFRSDPEVRIYRAELNL